MFDGKHGGIDLLIVAVEDYSNFLSSLVVIEVPLLRDAYPAVLHAANGLWWTLVRYIRGEGDECRAPYPQHGIVQAEGEPSLPPCPVSPPPPLPRCLIRSYWPRYDVTRRREV